MQKGFFVVFEGIDGSGKGTIIKTVQKFLASKGVSKSRIFVTAEPTNGFYGKKVRELLNSGVPHEVQAQTFLNLYVADRKEHIEKELLPALNEGKIVLCDRFKYSTFAYQSIQGIQTKKIAEMHEGMLVPDLVFVLSVSAQVSLKRISRRGRLESFEKKEFLEKASKAFDSLPEMFPEEKIVVIEASGSVNEVTRKVSKVLWEKLET